MEYLLIGLAIKTPSVAANAVVAAGCLLAVAYAVLTLLLLPYRLWSRPPTRVEVNDNGLTFLLAGGESRAFSWDNVDLRVEVLMRDRDPKVPPDARFRIFATMSPSETRRAWRQIVPLTYVSENAAGHILDEARRFGVAVTEDPGPQPFSFVSSRRGRLYRIGTRSD